MIILIVTSPPIKQLLDAGVLDTTVWTAEQDNRHTTEPPLYGASAVAKGPGQGSVAIYQRFGEQAHQSGTREQEVTVIRQFYRMVGHTGLAVAKALLTWHCRKLKNLVEECEAAKENTYNEEEDGIKSKAIELEEMTKLTSTSLWKFAEVVDSMSELTEEQKQEVQSYLEEAQG
ncbi:unnamed protein product [Cylicocyclus nassatus]|uniref:Uncharacterized protein n=1 Tax=Cylicocyclus nassatus TaxID=53992 RepID=A0AA36GHW0_CYLNA|nr:unnamed protein product [Cylicocyclus nassatus]